MQEYPSVWINEQSCDLEAFKKQADRKTQKSDCPLAAEIKKNIPIYAGDDLRALIATQDGTMRMMAEFNQVFKSGPGIIAVKGGYNDFQLIDDVTEVLFEMIDEEEAGDKSSGDHFAAAGQNSRLWNAHQKLAAREPELFIRYNANELIRRICQSWLGGGYQITTQVNVVRPGGQAQQAHRDYHMGIQTEAAMQATPASQHSMVAHLTLQGAVAHDHVPIDSGPTKLLPFSQNFVPGYLAVLREDFKNYFQESYVQLALEKGDLLFFNPATFHAAGENTTTNVQRIVNLMQVGTIYGRTMEYVDRAALVKNIYPQLLAKKENGALSASEIESVIAASAEAYPFPANLDNDAPLGPTGLTPASQSELLAQALEESWPDSRINEEIDLQEKRRFGA